MFSIWKKALQNPVDTTKIDKLSKLILKKWNNIDSLAARK